MSKTVIRSFLSTDIDNIVDQFASHNWTKPRVTFENHWQEKTDGERMVWLACYQQPFFCKKLVKSHQKRAQTS